MIIYYSCIKDIISIISKKGISRNNIGKNEIRQKVLDARRKAISRGKVIDSETPAEPAGDEEMLVLQIFSRDVLIAMLLASLATLLQFEVVSTQAL